MGRISQAINAGQVGAETTPTLNPVIGAQNGYLPEMEILGADGNKGGAWINNKHYVKRNVVPVLLQAPKGFDFLGEEKAKELREILKVLIETDSLRIEGLNSGLEVTSDETASGIAGQMFEDITGVTRQRSDVTHTYKDREGVPLRRFFDFYIKYLIEDPDTKSPAITTLESFDGADAPKLWTPDYYTFSAMYYEPDITNRHVIEAWVGVNMFPHGTGDITGKRDKEAAGATEEMAIRYGGLFLHNTHTRSSGQKMLDSMSVFKKLADISIKGVEVQDANVKSAEVGFDAYK